MKQNRGLRRLLVAGLAAAVAGLSWSAPDNLKQSLPWLSTVTSALAYDQMLATLSREQRDDYGDGAKAFARRWRTALSAIGPWGLGPLANGDSCVECHEGKGKTPPRAEANRLVGMVVRLSQTDPANPKQALPHAVYGAQLNDVAILDVPAEGYPVVDYHERAIAFGDGTTASLRVPRLRFAGLQYGPLGDGVLASARAAPALLGMGLLEAVPDHALLARQAQQAALGLAGRVNRVWDRERNDYVVARFGRKATQPSLLQQIAAAFHDDIGVTSALIPQDSCAKPQAKCIEVAKYRVSDPELSPGMLTDILLYLRAGAVPMPRNVNSPDVRRGESLFGQAGCAHCHQASMRTAANAALPQLSDQLFHPYTDLLLHDLGEDLADNRPDGRDAGGRDWRTAPLWGLGLANQVNPGAGLLHDGRARNAAEAILWHGGEALRSREAFRTMAQRDRTALLAFLNSL
jgi:CxxC motif-containing protein (DUF1111 family)